MLHAARHAFFLAFFCTAVALPVTAEPAKAAPACTGIDEAFSICGTTWRALPSDKPKGVSIWTDGEATAKIIVQPTAMAEQLSAEEVLNLAVDSVATSLPAGINLDITSGDVDILGEALFATLSYTLNNASHALHFRHAILVEDDRIIQLITAASKSDIDTHYQRLISSLSFEKPGKTI